jgi:UDP-glucose 4-epimerase
MRQAIQDKKIEVWNSTPVRDFVYVQDACEAFLKSLDSKYNGIINIASGIGTSVGEVCQEISKRTGAPIIDLGKQTSGPSHVVCDTGKAKLHLDWQAQTSLYDGIAKSIEYYQKSIPTVK